MKKLTIPPVRGSRVPAWRREYLLSRLQLGEKWVDRYRHDLGPLGEKARTEIWDRQSWWEKLLLRQWQSRESFIRGDYIGAQA